MFSFPIVYLNVISTQQYTADRRSFLFIEKLLVPNPSEQMLLLLFLRNNPRQIPNNPFNLFEKNSALTVGKHGAATGRTEGIKASLSADSMISKLTAI
jgi:hypothetical protein